MLFIDGRRNQPFEEITCVPLKANAKDAAMMLTLNAHIDRWQTQGNELPYPLCSHTVPTHAPE